MVAMMVMLVSLGLFFWALERNHRRNASLRPDGSGGGAPVGSTGTFMGDYGGRWTHRDRFAAEGK